jgi:CelD/BcsL family acetyltransferase involved in cellulose biosynthesis
MLRVSVVSETADLNALRDEWMDLVEKSSSPTIFDTFEWISTWWDELGRHTHSTKLFVLICRDSSGILQGIAPLYLSVELMPFARVLRFLGRGTSDYHDLIAADGSEAVISRCVLKFLLENKEWDVADLTNLRDEGVLGRFPESDLLSLKVYTLAQEPCLSINLPPHESGESRWNELLTHYNKKMRSHIRYYDRSLDRVYSVQRQVAATEQEAESYLTTLFFLHQRRWNKKWLPGVFYRPGVRRFHLRVSSLLLKKGSLRLHALRLDSAIEAVLYCFSFKHTTYYYQGGFEPGLAKRSLGTVLTANAVRQACLDGDGRFDFLRGSEPYKNRWANEPPRINKRLIITHAGYWCSSFIFWRTQILQKSENAIKSWLYRG